MSPISPFWSADRHADRRPALILRGRIKAALREWFEAQGFIEVEPSCLQVSPGNETHLHAFATEWRTETGSSRPMYLHTSPEFAMKKLLAAGEQRIFAFAPVFRNGERSARHSPEFTMLEWYRVDEPYTRLMDDCAEILAIAAKLADKSQFEFQGRRCSPRLAPARHSIAALFARLAGIDLLDETLHADGSVDRDAMARAVARADVRVAADDTWTDLFSRVLVERIEPALGATSADRDRAVIVDEYPTHEAALARPSPSDRRVAERFELYACGLELANAFGELTDPAEQRRRFEAEMDEKHRLYGERYPIDEDFLAALARMPPASGCALGFDRLVMLAAGATTIDQVLWTPVAEGGTTTA